MKDGSRQTAYEAYAFACLSCGHGWEQSYRIEHYLDPDGQPYVLYFAGGEQVPSPLARLTCMNCGGHRVRMMRAGSVAAAERAERADARRHNHGDG